MSAPVFARKLEVRSLIQMFKEYRLLRREFANEIMHLQRFLSVKCG